MFDTDLLFDNKKLPLAFCQMKPAISIIIPAFEEEDRLGESIGEILTYIVNEKLSAELIIVDDGSNDKTCLTAKRFWTVQFKGCCGRSTRILRFLRGTSFANFTKNKPRNFTASAFLFCSGATAFMCSQ